VTKKFHGYLHNKKAMGFSHGFQDDGTTRFRQGIPKAMGATRDFTSGFLTRFLSS
jgi:hypothetical protein